MSDETKRIIEVNGIKMEIDLRQATVLTEYKVGTPVKVLTKGYSSYDVRYGTIVGFTEFKSQPTIELLVVDRYGALTFLAYNSETKDTEIAPCNPYEMVFDVNDVIRSMNRSIDEKIMELNMLKMKREAFKRTMGKSFNIVIEEESKGLLE